MADDLSSELADWVAEVTGAARLTIHRGVGGASRFAQIVDADDQLSVARQFMEQLAELHRLDPHTLDLPELGAPGPLHQHVLDEIAEWETQYETAGGGVPVIALAFAWLRE